MFDCRLRIDDSDLHSKLIKHEAATSVSYYKTNLRMGLSGNLPVFIYTDYLTAADLIIAELKAKNVFPSSNRQLKTRHRFVGLKFTVA